MDEVSKKTVTTRMRLVERLVTAGVKCKVIPNMWGEKYTTWLFDINSTSTEVVKQFYHEIGKELPRAFQEEQGGR